MIMPGKVASDATISSPNPVPSLETTALPRIRTDLWKTASPSRPNSVKEKETRSVDAAKLEEEERYHLNAADTPEDADFHRLSRAAGVHDSNDRVGLRCELAKEMLVVLDSLERNLTQVSSVVYIQKIKSLLVRCHTGLGPTGKEDDFLSLVALIESCLTNHSWKDLTAAHLEILREALTAAYKQPRITHRDYRRLRQRFRDAGFADSPSDLSLEPDAQPTTGKDAHHGRDAADSA